MNLEIFKVLILNKCGLSFENERQEILAKGVRCRMAARSLSGDDYLSILKVDNDELSSLVNLLTVNETYFFREPDHLQIMVDRLIPGLFTERTFGGKIRILSAGCSTGEEPYSIAMTLIERYGVAAFDRFSIIAVDVDTDAIARAQAGIYGKGSFRGFKEGRRGRFFDEAADGRFSIREEVKKLVSFEVVNLLSNPYPETMQKLDIIFYRNVSIYFPQLVQREIFANLAGILKTNGYLFLSASETFFHNIGILSLVEMDLNFLYRKGPLLEIGDRRLGRLNSSPASSAKQHTPCRRQPPPVVNGGANATASASPALSPQQLFDKVLAMARGKEYLAALQDIDLLLSLYPQFIKAFMLKASVLINQNRLEEAKAATIEALKLDAWALEGHLLLGIIARISSRDEDALNNFKKSLYIDSSCWLAHFYLAEIHLLRNEQDTARREYEIVMKLLGKGENPNAGLTYFPLAFQAEQVVTLCRYNLTKLGSAEA